MWLRFALSALTIVFVLGARGATTKAQDVEPAVGYPSAEPQGYPTTQSLYGVSITTRQATRLRALEAHLGGLASRSDGRILDGSLTIVLGGAFITIGVFVDDPLARALLITTGGVAVGRGVLSLSLLPDAEKTSIEFAHMPMLSAAQVIARIAHGEEALARLARRYRAARIADGSLTMFAGLSYVPAYMYARERESSRWQFGDDGADYVVAAFGLVSFTAGLVTVLVKSDAEHRYKAYAKLRDRLAEEERSGRVSYLPQVAPYASRDGAGVAARLEF